MSTTTSLHFPLDFFAWGSICFFAFVAQVDEIRNEVLKISSKLTQFVISCFGGFGEAFGQMWMRLVPLNRCQGDVSRWSYSRGWSGEGPSKCHKIWAMFIATEVVLELICWFSSQLSLSSNATTSAWEVYIWNFDDTTDPGKTNWGVICYKLQQVHFTTCTWKCQSPSRHFWNCNGSKLPTSESISVNCESGFKKFKGFMSVMKETCYYPKYLWKITVAWSCPTWQWLYYSSWVCSHIWMCSWDRLLYPSWYHKGRQFQEFTGPHFKR